jgi:hypothetical protein
MATLTMTVAEQAVTAIELSTCPATKREVGVGLKSVVVEQWCRQ